MTDLLTNAGVVDANVYTPTTPNVETIPQPANPVAEPDAIVVENKNLKEKLDSTLKEKTDTETKLKVLREEIGVKANAPKSIDEYNAVQLSKEDFIKLQSNPELQEQIRALQLEGLNSGLSVKQFENVAKTILAKVPNVPTEEEVKNYEVEQEKEALEILNKELDKVDTDPVKRKYKLEQINNYINSDNFNDAEKEQMMRLLSGANSGDYANILLKQISTQYAKPITPTYSSFNSNANFNNFSVNDYREKLANPKLQMEDRIKLCNEMAARGIKI